MNLVELYILIKRFEGCRLVAYLCPAGIWTIGWGSTGPGIHDGVVWTQDQADERLALDAESYALRAVKLSPILALHGEALQAIADFLYNLGPTRYKASTLKRRIDAGDFLGACEELAKWVFGGGRRLPGLILRREAESLLIQGGLS